MYLSLFGKDFDSIKSIILLDLNDDFFAFTGCFIHTNDSIQPPVSDVNNVLEDDKRKRVTDKSGADRSDVRSVEFRVLDVIQKSVTPVEPVSLEIDGETVGPTEKDILEDHQVGAVKVSSADVGRPVPFRVEDETFIRMDNNGSGTLQITQ